MVFSLTSTKYTILYERISSLPLSICDASEEVCTVVTWAVTGRLIHPGNGNQISTITNILKTWVHT